jgi:hypothetical protein
VNAEHIHAVEQVLAETPALDFRRQIAIRRRNDPHVDADGLFPADALDCFFLEGARELCLHAPRRHFPDLVEKSVPPLANSNFPMWVWRAPVKAPCSWPKRIDSMSSEGMAEQLMMTNGASLKLARLDESFPGVQEFLPVEGWTEFRVLARGSGLLPAS